MLVPAQPFDDTLLALLNQPGNPALDRAAWAASSTLVLVPVLLLLALWVGLRSPHRWIAAAMVVLAAGAGDLVSVRVAKPLVQRMRPCRERPESVVAPLGCGPSFSFPSSHATNAAAAATVVAWASPALLPLASLLALAIGVSRVYLGVHWPSDVLGGFALGIAVGWLVVRVYLLKGSVRRVR